MPSLLRQLADAIPAWQRRFTRKFLVDTVIRMNELVESSGKTQKEIAEAAGWKEPYLSRILSGRNNITLRTLARFEEAVGADVLTVTGSRRKIRHVSRASSDVSPMSSMAPAPAIATSVAKISLGAPEETAANDYSHALQA